MFGRTFSILSTHYDNALSENDVNKGYLQKQRPTMIKVWQKRFFVLEYKSLKYYAREEDYLNKLCPKGVLNFNMVQIKANFQGDLRFSLQIVGSDRIFHLKCGTDIEFKKWKKKLEHTI